MKLAKFVLAEAVYAIEFNPDGKSTELAQLEKWSKLAHKFFDLHGSDLRKSFVRKWIGSENQKFDKQITKLTRAFNRCGTHLDPVMLDIPQNYTNIEADVDGQNREKRSNEDPRIMERPGHRILHVVHNMKKWTKTYLSECKNQNKIVTRYEKFEDKFENELMKSPVFADEFREDEVLLENLEQRAIREGRGRACGKIWSEFGLHGKNIVVYDSSIDEDNGFHDLGRTTFGRYKLQSMQVLEDGKFDFDTIFYT